MLVFYVFVGKLKIFSYTFLNMYLFQNYHIKYFKKVYAFEVKMFFTLNESIFNIYYTKILNNVKNKPLDLNKSFNMKFFLKIRFTN